MENQKYSGEVNLDYPVIDERPDGIYLYFTPMPDVLLRNPIHFSPQDLDDPPPDHDT